MTQPYTVLLSIPDDFANDESCAADCVIRIYVNATDPEGALAIAYDDGCINQEYRDGYAPVAIYEGHLFDLFQP